MVRSLADPTFQPSGALGEGREALGGDGEVGLGEALEAAVREDLRSD